MSIIVIIIVIINIKLLQSHSHTNMCTVLSHRHLMHWDAKISEYIPAKNLIFTCQKYLLIGVIIIFV